MICSNCGNELAEGSVFCGNCGATVDTIVQEAAHPGVYEGGQQWAVGTGAGQAAPPQGAPPQGGFDAAQAPYQTQQFSYQHDAAQPLPAHSAQPYGGASAQPYSVVAASPQPKKKKTMLIVGIIAAAVLGLVVGGFGGFLIYQSMTDGGAPSRQPPVDDPATQDPALPPSTATNFVAAFENPYVIIDEAEVKITIDLGSGERDRSGSSYYTVSCVVENKTSNFFDVHLEEPSGNGFISGGSVYISKEGRYGAGKNSSDFAPGESFASIVFDRDDIDGKLTNFKLRLTLSKAGEYKDFALYNITVPEF